MEFYILCICSIVACLSLLLYKLTDSTLAILALLNFQRRVAVFRVIPVIGSTGLAYEQMFIVDNYVGGDWFPEKTGLTVAH